ncbi:NADPH-dependent FMN reductase [Paenibacillus sp. LHD-117]|uniref:NADPH-dependent FMN reductase n=1 Tax=Paenibacillus sp. LHD-117 TaxID=3071412 RepID=UPI0027E0A4CC|nr:NADPH-dependent FMN reductase [Paenibacillus sp. LHD-117]MDQ6418747.1 NADPH-dependent FMN reductase [Paenibacillus sp. LHD-117]
MNVIIIAGSNHKGATSTRLSEYVSSLITAQGHQSSVFNLYERPLPFYSPDGEYGSTESISELQKVMRAADAIVLATPEYHSSISGVLKNALDHLGQDYFRGKVVLSMSSAGGAVGTSSLQQLQAIVRNLHGINLPEWVSIGGAQRNWFMEPHTDHEGAGSDILDRVKRVTLSFLELASRVRAN